MTRQQQYRAATLWAPVIYRYQHGYLMHTSRRRRRGSARLCLVVGLRYCFRVVSFHLPLPFPSGVLLRLPCLAALLRLSALLALRPALLQ